MSESVNELPANTIVTDLAPSNVEPLGSRRLQRGSTDRSGLRMRAEWQELALVVEAMSVARSTLVVQFVGPVSSVGTTVIAAGFAQVTALRDTGPRCKEITQSKSPVLLLDCGPLAGGTRRLFRTIARPETVAEAYNRDPNLDSLHGVPIIGGVTTAKLGLIDRDGVVRYSSECIAEMIGKLRNKYSVIVLDCPAVSRSIAGPLLAPHSDSTILVVKAGSTRQADLASSRARLEQVGGKLAGVVFNRMPVQSRWWSDRG